MNRRSRDFDALSEAQMLAGRTASREVSASGLLRADAPRAMAELLDTIQHVAEAATGERSFLHLRPGDARISGVGPQADIGGCHAAPMRARLVSG